MTVEREIKLYESTETARYIVEFNPSKSRWELKGKVSKGSLKGRTFFMNSCQFQTPLLVAQRDLEARKSK